MNIIRNILHAWYNEFHAVTHDVGLMLFGVIVPLAYPLLYAFIYTNETVREVPMAVVDDCQSPMSREFARKVDACSEVEVLYHCDMAQARELMRREEVYGILYFSSDFERNLNRGLQSNVALYSDMRCMLYYKSMLIAATNVSLDMNRDIKVTRFMRGSTDRQEELMTTPVSSAHIPLFNPQSGFASFLLPAVLMMVIQQLLFLTIGLSMGKTREENMGCGITQIGECSFGPFCVVVGKLLFYVPLFMLMGVYMYAVVTPLFSFIQLGDYYTFLSFLFPYVLACTLMGITLSCFIHRGEDTMLLYVFLTLPLLFLSGMSWPLASVPEVWKYFSYLFPSSFGTHGYVRIMGTGCDLSAVGHEFRALWIQCVVYFFTSLWVYRGEKRRKFLLTEEDEV